MCVVIFAGTKADKLVETGMDCFAKKNGVITDEDFFLKNMGPGKLYPTGPTCTYKGKEVPCLCRWTKKGSIGGHGEDIGWNWSSRQ